MKSVRKNLEHIVLCRCFADVKQVESAEELVEIFQQKFDLPIDWVRTPVFWETLRKCEKTGLVVHENICYDIVHWGWLRFQANNGMPFIEVKEAMRLIYEKCNIVTGKSWSLVVPSSAIIQCFNSDEKALKVWKQRETLEEYPFWMVRNFF